MSEPVVDFKSLMRREEGLSLKETPDVEGHVIGYGRNTLTRGISTAEAEMLLANDDREVTGDCETIPYFLALSLPRQGVLKSMCYEMGFKGLLGFRKMLADLADGEWDKAAADLLDSTYARNTETAGRANRLATQLREDRWV